MKKKQKLIFDIFYGTGYRLPRRLQMKLTDVSYHHVSINFSKIIFMKNFLSANEMFSARIFILFSEFRNSPWNYFQKAFKNGNSDKRAKCTCDFQTHFKNSSRQNFTVSKKGWESWLKTFSFKKRNKLVTPTALDFIFFAVQKTKI